MSNTTNMPTDPPLALKKRAVVVEASSGIGEAIARKRLSVISYSQRCAGSLAVTR